MARAKAEGKQIGRPVRLVKLTEVQQLRSQDSSISRDCLQAPGAEVNRGETVAKDNATHFLRTAMLLTVKEVGEQLKINASTLYAWAAQGRIPSVKLNGQIRFERDAIQRWVEANRQPSEKTSATVRPGVQPDVKALVARARREAHTPSLRGNHTTIKPTRKEKKDGLV